MGPFGTCSSLPGSLTESSVNTYFRGIVNMWNLFELNKICMEHSAKARFIPEKLTVKIGNNGHQQILERERERSKLVSFIDQRIHIYICIGSIG